MPADNTPSEEEFEEVTRRNAEESRKLIEQRRRRGETDEVEDTPRPPAPNPEDIRDDAPPGQRNVPLGGTQGANVGGGTTKHHKPG